MSPAITPQPESWRKEWPHWYVVEARKPSPSLFNLYMATPRVFIDGKLMGMKPLEFAMSTEPIMGWRAWAIVDFKRRGGVQEKRLQALGMKPVWEPFKENVAICTSDGTHEAPWPGCHCGFWAFKQRRYVEQSLFDSYNGEMGKVIGEVALWGRVLECTNGYRGEFAYPQHLQFIGLDSKIADDISECYGIPGTVVEPSGTFKCEGKVMQCEYDYDRMYASILYNCGLEMRVEISRHWEGKQTFDPDHIPPCPDHYH